MDDLYAIVLAGGLGTRLWPLSRARAPKQLLPFIGDESLLALTARRLLHKIAADHVYTVTHADHRDEVVLQLGKISCDLANHVFAEPEGKNTLPAISWMVGLIAKQNTNACVAVFPSDHAIRDTKAFLEALSKTISATDSGQFVLFGITPTHASSEYGYIQTCGGGDVLKIENFFEKPSEPKAKEYLASGNFFWNSGMFVFKVATFLDALQRHQPQIYELVQQLIQKNESVANSEMYARFSNLSIDYGLMEKPVKKVVVPASMGWTDLGSWPAVGEYLPKNSHGNVTLGSSLDIDNKSQNSLVANYSNQLLVTMGLKDAVVVKTADVTLVAHRDAVRDIKAALREVEKIAPQTLKVHSRENRPWGFFRTIEEGPGYKVKYISVNPGESLSLQRHSQRTEHWVIVTGQASVRRDEAVDNFKAGDYIFIGQGCAHQLTNNGSEGLVVIETQRGAYLGEDDIVRLKDKYGRVK